MKFSKNEMLGALLVLGATSVAAGIGSAQRGGGRARPLQGGSGSEPCYCDAEGSDCLFGNAGGCSVTCPDGGCDCIGASCRLGFPTGSRCRCRNGLPST
jgi:hypothetical protein